MRKRGVGWGLSGEEERGTGVGWGLSGDKDSGKERFLALANETEKSVKPFESKLNCQKACFY